MIVVIAFCLKVLSMHHLLVAATAFACCKIVALYRQMGITPSAVFVCLRFLLPLCHKNSYTNSYHDTCMPVSQVLQVAAV